MELNTFISRLFEAAQAAGVEPRTDHAVVVVAREQQQLAVGAEPVAERAQERPGAGEDLARRRVAQLEQVAGDDEPPGVVERTEQPLTRRAVRPEQVDPRVRPQVQVGDDEAGGGAAGGGGHAR